MLADQRAAITAALDTLTGVNAMAKAPTAPNLRDAWPLLDTLDRGPGLTFQATWRVIVWLGYDEVTAQDVGDELLHTIAEGLVQVAFVDQASFVTVKGGESFALEIRVRCEE